MEIRQYRGESMYKTEITIEFLQEQLRSKKAMILALNNENRRLREEIERLNNKLTKVFKDLGNK